MDRINLSRRSMLKASSFFAAAAVVAPAAVAASSIPDVLQMLLAEYAAAGAQAKATHAALGDAQRAKNAALDAARMFVLDADGDYHRLGETGRAVHPEYLAHLFRQERSKALATADTQAEAVDIKRAYRLAFQRLGYQAKRYGRIVELSGYNTAVDAEIKAYDRFSDARAALVAYPVTTVAEIAAIAQACVKLGSYVGVSHGLHMRDLAGMLESVGA